LDNHLKAPVNAWLIYTAWIALGCLFYLKPLKLLASYALSSENASHVLAVPLIVAWLLYADRGKLSSDCAFDFPLAMLFIVPAAFIWISSLWNFPAFLHAPVSLSILGLILFLIAGFICIFGRKSAKSAWFSLAFLAFAIPLPETLLDRYIYLLQHGSAAVAEWIFDCTGVPVLREGFVFHLSGLSIEVAKECSGIRSSIALVILAVLVAHFAFAKFWKKAVFITAGLLMMAVKNGVRIATLTILANYVDPDFLAGRLHRQGGVVFFLFGLLLLWPVYWLLRRGEEHDPLNREIAGTDPKSRRPQSLD